MGTEESGGPVDCESRGAEILSGGGTLAGCPSEGHIRWDVGARQHGMGLADPAEMAAHVAIEPNLVEPATQMVHAFSRAPSAVVEVRGWRRSSTGAAVVEYTGADGRGWELHYDLAADGRIETPRAQRSLGGIEIAACCPQELSPEDREVLFNVFDATYAAADHGHLNRQLDSFGSIAVARERGTIVGFYVADVRSIDLPVIGAQICGRAGLTCVVPEARRSGVMVSLAGSAWPHSAVNAGHGGFSLMASRMATPASLNAGFGAVQRGAWPTADAPFALYDHPTSTQVAVARAIAESFGSPDYDSKTGVCVGTGRTIGTPRVESNAPSPIVERFRAVDRDRGDALLWITWVVPPPQAWFA